MMQVFLIVALSADGFIAKDPSAPSTSWTSKEDAAWFRQKTKEAGVCVMGRKTFETIGRPLGGRLTVVLTQDKNYKLPVVADNLEISNDEPEALLRKLENRGFSQVAICGGRSIYTLFMTKGLIDKLYLTIEPVIFGQGTKLFSESLDTKLKLLAVHSLSDQTKVLEYQV